MGGVAGGRGPRASAGSGQAAACHIRSDRWQSTRWRARPFRRSSPCTSATDRGRWSAAAFRSGRRTSSSRRPRSPPTATRCAGRPGASCSPSRARSRSSSGPGPSGSPPADAWSHVRWVTAANDFGVYDLRYADRGSNVRSKGIDGFTPIGPALLDAQRRRPGARHAADLGQRRARAGRRQRRRPAVLVRRHRGRPIAADHAGAGRRDPHRHPDRVHRGPSRRPGRGRGQRGHARPAERRGAGDRAVNRPAALADRRGRLPARAARRDAERRRRRSARRPTAAAAPPGPPTPRPSCSPRSPGSRPRRSPPSCASAASTTSRWTGC